MTSNTIVPSVRAQITERRTYLRPLNDEGTLFETFEQSIDRQIDHQRWLWERAKGGLAKDKSGKFILVPLTASEEAELDELRILLLSRKATLSGRTSWLGGTDIAKRRESSMFNPGRRSTKFITTKGVKSFEDFEDGDIIEAFTHLGNYKKARVMMAGRQPINKITFSRGRTVQEEYFTPTHSWVLHDGTRTMNLKVGDRLWTPSSSFYDWTFETASAEEQMWWAYGFVYGDGTIVNGHSRVRLCGNKGQYLSRFTSLGFGHSFPPSCSEDPIVYTGKYLKTLPDLEEDSIEMVRAFIHGYLAADGNRNANSLRDGQQWSGIQTTGQASAEFIEKAFPLVGLYIFNKREITGSTNYGERSGGTYSFTFRANFGTNSISNYSVKSIEPQGEEEVWCLTVDDDHSFVLPNGIVTGNCSFLEVRTVYDVVDILWLLLQGCGVGFRPVVGTLNGFQRPLDVEIVRSERTAKGGKQDNYETFDPKTGVWTIRVGDSAEAWAKSIGKILAGKYPATKLIIDFSEVRPAGDRLKGYGWISSGDYQISVAYKAITHILNKRAGQLLDRIDILDIVNWLGTVLSSRRSAEICLIAFEEPQWQDFATAKRNWWDYKNIETGEAWDIPEGLSPFNKDDKPVIDALARAAGAQNNQHRQQSNNTLLFFRRPTKEEIQHVFDLMVESGGSEPGFANAVEALNRGAWFKGFNPCAEILLGDKSFCNLVETVLFRFNGDFKELLRAHWIVARANYRQTCVWLDDGILQRAWHELNQFLRLCGVGVTGVVSWDRQDDGESWARLKVAAVDGANSIADELGMPRAKAVTTIKPSGTKSKTLSLLGAECPEGLHKPLGRFIFNNMMMSEHDPLVTILTKAGYYIFRHPTDPTSVIVRIPVEYSNIPFEKITRQLKRKVSNYVGNGEFETVETVEDVVVEVNLESAVSQLNRYKLVMENYVQHNASVTVSFDPSEVPDIVNWFHENWDTYVGVSFLYRNDPSKTAEDLGYSYLPQSVVDEATFREYVNSLKPIDWTGSESELNVDTGEECATGACPVR